MSTRKALRAEGDQLKKYFNRDPRFEFVGIIGAGATGVASRVRYNDPDNGAYKSFVIKRSINKLAEQRALKNEEAHIRSMKGAMHIVQVLDIHDNPLERPGTDELPVIEGHWVILEYLENGSIEKFINNATESLTTRLPNRLLWRFFLCLIKASIAMTYPENINRGMLVSETIPADDANHGVEKGLSHNDIQPGNVLLGDALKDGEHGITPQLKMIDFGTAAKFTTGGVLPSLDDIAAIGEIMLGLIILDPVPLISPGHQGPSRFKANDDAEEIMTQAVELTPEWTDSEKYAWLDHDLRVLVCNLLRVDKEKQPSLRDLDREITAAVHERDAAYYNDEEIEKDYSIKKLWHDIVHWTGP
ncbi:hypothetical protein F4806DRAFT_295786 [Annulohypoxylon nitens]|nr:hypothetical protein F4806DRAFT_295786 [Annulohypoxylon nitens]